MLLLAITMCIGFSVVQAGPPQKPDTIFHLQKLNGKKDKSYLKAHVTLPAVKAYVIPTSKPQTNVADDKLLSNVQIYPNPVTDQINLKYSISRNANVNIKIMDVLGNEVITLFSRRVEPGEQQFKYTLGNKLNSGFYFVRVVVGTESVIKRISIL